VPVSNCSQVLPAFHSGNYEEGFSMTSEPIGKCCGLELCKQAIFSIEMWLFDNRNWCLVDP